MDIEKKLEKGYAVLEPNTKLPPSPFECVVCHKQTAEIKNFALCWLPAAIKPTSQNPKPRLPIINSMCDNCGNVQFFMIPSVEYIKIK